MALVAFIFIVFGIVGMEVFKGVLHYRCTSEPGYREPQGHPLNERRLEELAFLNGMGGMGGGSVGGVASSHAIFGGVDGGALMAPYALVSTANASALAALAGAMGGRLNSSSSREGSSRSSSDSSIGGSSSSSGGGDGLLAHAWKRLDEWARGGRPGRSRRSLKGGGGGGGGGGEEGDGASYDSGIICNPAAAPSVCRVAVGGPSRCAYFDDNPADGLMSFDSVAATSILILQSFTFDTWTDAMFTLDSPGAMLYFCLIVVLGGWFVVNLFLAVIFQEFLEAQQVNAAVEDAEQTAAALKADVTDVEGGRAAADSGSDVAALLAGGGVSSSGAPYQVHRHCCDCTPRAGSCRAVALRGLVEAEWFGNTSTLMVLLNLALMCMAYEGMSDEYAATLEVYASVITWVFIVEMFLKLCGLGCSRYWGDGWNQLDGCIVIMSIVEMLVTILLAGSGVNMSFLRTLRMLRLVRMLRLMKSWKELYKIVMTFGKALPQLANIFVLMFLILVIFSLLGMQVSHLPISPHISAHISQDLRSLSHPSTPPQRTTALRRRLQPRLGLLARALPRRRVPRPVPRGEAALPL